MREQFSKKYAGSEKTFKRDTKHHREEAHSRKLADTANAWSIKSDQATVMAEGVSAALDTKRLAQHHTSHVVHQSAGKQNDRRVVLHKSKGGVTHPHDHLVTVHKGMTHGGGHIVERKHGHLVMERPESEHFVEGTPPPHGHLVMERPESEHFVEGMPPHGHQVMVRDREGSLAEGRDNVEERKLPRGHVVMETPHSFGGEHIVEKKLPHDHLVMVRKGAESGAGGHIVERKLPQDGRLRERRHIVITDDKPPHRHVVHVHRVKLVGEGHHGHGHEDVRHVHYLER